MHSSPYKVGPGEMVEALALHKKWLNKKRGGVRMVFNRCSFAYMDLSRANLSHADLSYSDLNGLNLKGANFTGAILTGARLGFADLSGAKGLLSPSEWLFNNFKSTSEGLIVYKRIGDTEYPKPKSWVIAPLSELREVCNYDRCIDCGCGVNFATRNWCEIYYRDAVLWECLIRWSNVAGVVVPYGTDGKARCERLTLLNVVG